MRRKDREVTALKEVRRIVDTAKILHLGLFDGAYPYIVPLHYGYLFEGTQLIFYTHGAKEGHKLDLIRRNANICVEVECDVALVSGGDIPCRYGSTYASVIGRGKAEIVEDVQEKIRGLDLLMVHQTERKFEIDELMAASVSVIKITVENYTAKARRRDKN